MAMWKTCRKPLGHIYHLWCVLFDGIYLVRHNRLWPFLGFFLGSTFLSWETESLVHELLRMYLYCHKWNICKYLLWWSVVLSSVRCCTGTTDFFFGQRLMASGEANIVFYLWRKRLDEFRSKMSKLMKGGSFQGKIWGKLFLRKWVRDVKDAWEWTIGAF